MWQRCIAMDTSRNIQLICHLIQRWRIYETKKLIIQLEFICHSIGRVFGKPCIFFANANYFFHSLFSKRSSLYRRLLLPLPAQASSDDCDDDTDDNNFNEHNEIHLSSNFVLWVSSVSLLLPRLFLEEAAHDDRGGHYADQHSLDKDDPCCIFHPLSEKSSLWKTLKGVP